MSTNVANQGAIFTSTETKIYVPAVTLSTQDHLKLSKQLKSSFKRTINWSNERRNMVVNSHHEKLNKKSLNSS